MVFRGLNMLLWFKKIEKSTKCLYPRQFKKKKKVCWNACVIVLKGVSLKIHLNKKLTCIEKIGCIIGVVKKPLMNRFNEDDLENFKPQVWEILKFE
jgi:hypothetical protein